MEKELKVAVIGGGSWGTALVKILLNKDSYVNWWVRRQETVDYIKNYHRNPNYLRYAELYPERLLLSTDLKQIIDESDMLIFAIPAPFLKETLDKANITDLSDKIIVSAIKGIVPFENNIVGDFFQSKYNVKPNNIGVIAGPCHSEEVSMQKLSYLTIAFKDNEKANFLAGRLQTRFMKISTTNDIVGTEYAAVLKNIIAIANGICIGLGYGDNFQAVLIVNAVREVKRFLSEVNHLSRDINETVYMGDIIVTAYSKFSRNRMFGNFIGKGYSVKSTMAEMKMVAEGYYAVKCIVEINKKHQVYMPITQAVYNIIYNRHSPFSEVKLLADKLN